MTHPRLLRRVPATYFDPKLKDQKIRGSEYRDREKIIVEIFAEYDIGGSFLIVTIKKDRNSDDYEIIWSRGSRKYIRTILIFLSQLARIDNTYESLFEQLNAQVKKDELREKIKRAVDMTMFGNLLVIAKLLDVDVD